LHRWRMRSFWGKLTKILKSLGWVNIVKVSAVFFFVLAIIALLVIVFIPDSPVESVLFDFLEWLDDVPVYYGSLLMLVVQTGAIILMLPGTPFNLACGFIFDLWIGALVSVGSADLAAIFSFLAVRFFARDWAARQIEKRPKFKAIDRAVEQHGMWLIVLIRISPILPFGLCNYMLGLTNVPFWKYWLASTVGLVPYTVAYTYLGSLLRGLADVFTDDSDSTESIILLSVGGGVTVITIVAVALVTKRALSRVVVEETPPEICTAEEGQGAAVIVTENVETQETDEKTEVRTIDGWKAEAQAEPRANMDYKDEGRRECKETTPLVPKKRSNSREWG